MLTSLSHWSIGQRLAAGFATLMGLAVVAVALALAALSQVAGATRDMMAEPLLKERLVQEWSRNISVAVRRTAAVAMSDDAQLAEFFGQEQKASAERSAELQNQIEALIANDPEDRRIYEDIQAKRKAYLAARDAVMKARKAGDSDGAQAQFQTEFTPRVAPYLEAVDALVKRQREAIDNTAKGIEQSSSRSKAVLTLLSAAMLGVATVLAWRLTRSIVEPLHEAVKAAEQVAAGNLAEPIRPGLAGSRYEIDLLRTALAGMAESLAQLVRSIRESSASIAVAASEIAQGNQDLSSRTEHQAANLEETTAAIVELTNAVRSNSDELRTAGLHSNSAAGIATEAGQVVAEVSASMRGIEGSARQISQITAVIDGIAFQTNILALNAAVEAARAGESGRGFAVVASEVRSLAQRAGEAAKQIRHLIEQSVTEVGRGSQLTRKAQATMEAVVQSVGSVAAASQSIVQSSEEQRRGIEEVNTAMQQIDTITQQNAALVEEATAAAASLREQTVKLEDELRRFVL